MPPHRDWTRHGVGRALLWWPFMAFVLVAAFPAFAVPCMIGSGVALVFVGLVGGAVGRRRRAGRLRRAGRAVGPRSIAPSVTTLGRDQIVVAASTGGEGAGEAVQDIADPGDAEDDHPAHLHQRAA